MKKSGKKREQTKAHTQTKTKDKTYNLKTKDK